MAKKINSRQKGARGERELAKKLFDVFGISARRGQQYCGIEGKDVVGIDKVHVECKRVEKLNLEKAMQQAIQDASPDDVPAVFHRKSRQPWLVTVRIEQLLELADNIRAATENVKQVECIGQMKLF